MHGRPSYSWFRALAPSYPSLPTGEDKGALGAEGRSRTGTGLAPQRFLRPSRLPVPPLRHASPALPPKQHTACSYATRIHSLPYSPLEATSGFEPLIGVLQTPALATWPRRPVLERKTRFELATLSLARRCSTTEPLPHRYAIVMPRPRSVSAGERT